MCRTFKSDCGMLPLLPAGCLQGLLTQERVTLYCYRWQAATPGGPMVAANGGSSIAADLAAEAANSPQLQQLLGSLQQLGLLLPAPLPDKLPTFSLAVPAASNSAEQDGAPAGQPSGPTDASTPAAAISPSKDAGGEGASAGQPTGGGKRAAAVRTVGTTACTISVQLVPAGTVELSADQLKPLLGCSNALLAHMFARGSYCGAATKLIASEAGEVDAAPAEPAEGGEDGPDGMAAAGAAAGATEAPGTPPAADPSAPSSPPVVAGSEGMPPASGAGQQPGKQQHEPMQVDSEAGKAQPAGTTQPATATAAPAAAIAAASTAPATAGTAPIRQEDAEAAAAAEQLVQRALHRVLLLHDKKVLPRRKRTRAEEQAAELASCATAADEAGFLLAPLLVEAGQAGTEMGDAGSGSQASCSGGGSNGAAAALDWAAVHEIAAVAAFEGNLLEWLSQQEEEEGEERAAEEPATKAAHSIEAGAGSQSRPCKGSLLSSSHAAALSGRVVVTCYNGQSYLHRWVILYLANTGCLAE